MTFKFVCFDRIEGKKLVVGEKREMKKENKKREKEREFFGMFWTLEEVVGKKEKSKSTCVEEKKRGEKRRKYG